MLAPTWNSAQTNEMEIPTRPWGRRTPAHLLPAQHHAESRRIHPLAEPGGQGRVPRFCRYGVSRWPWRTR